jgi:anti-sigma B factor antagonist
MTNNAPSLLVAVIDRAAVVKVNGRANFTASVTFKRLVGELRDRGFDHFLLDLTDCITMDSTFLGVLAGTAVKLCGCASQTPTPAPANQAQLCLMNPNARVLDLLDNLGVSELFRTVQRATPIAGEERLTPATEVNASREEISRTCLEAHQVLMEVNPNNVPKFKDVAQFLAEDVKKLSAEKANAPASPEANASTQPAEVGSR